jgi:hypothetical protein
MTATGAAHVYQKAFILSAVLDFAYADDDARRHVTNLSEALRGLPGTGAMPSARGVSAGILPFCQLCL